MQRVVVTGSAGFIGSLLSKKLVHSGYEVVGIDNMSYGYKDNLLWTEGVSTFRQIELDILSDTVQDYLQKGDIVVHCAGIAPLPINQEFPKVSLTNNVAGTANLLEACRLKGVKHVFLASTSAVYENSKVFPSKETESVTPFLLYSLGKKFCEDLCASFHTNYGLPYTILRFFNVYGPHHDCLRKNPPLIAYLVKSFLEMKQPLLHSNGLQRRDYIFIDDLLDLLLRMIQSPEKGCAKTYNICSGETVSVQEIVSQVQKLMSTQMQPIYREPSLLWETNQGLWKGELPLHSSIVHHEVTKYAKGSFEQAHADFGWSPRVSFEEGLRLTVQDSIRRMS